MSFERADGCAYRMFIYGGAHSLPVAASAQFVELTGDFLTRGEAFIVGRPETRGRPRHE